jgi:hypothetical protein
MTQKCAICGRPSPELNADQVLRGDDHDRRAARCANAGGTRRLRTLANADALAASGRLAWHPGGRG